MMTPKYHFRMPYCIDHHSEWPWIGEQVLRGSYSKLAQGSRLIPSPSALAQHTFLSSRKSAGEFMRARGKGGSKMGKVCYIQGLVRCTRGASKMISTTAQGYCGVPEQLYWMENGSEASLTVRIRKQQYCSMSFWLFNEFAGSC